MGGINHQPCGNYIKESTKLSRSMSLAHLNLDLANVALEDILLAELDGRTQSVDHFEKHLSQSIVHLEDTLVDIKVLRAKMAANHFVDLPTLKTLDWPSLGSELARRGIIGQKEWEHVVERLQAGGFSTVIADHCASVQELIQLSRELRDRIVLLQPVAAVGGVHAVLEENLSGNIKVPFARLYCAWLNFKQLFLASSIASTEQWYVYMGYGSLCSEVAPDNKRACVRGSIAADSK